MVMVAALTIRMPFTLIEGRHLVEDAVARRRSIAIDGDAIHGDTDHAHIRSAGGSRSCRCVADGG